MISFKALATRTESEKALSNMKLRDKLATSCLESCKTSSLNANENIYSALSHLAQVEELKVDLIKYDDLQFNPNDTDFKAYAYAKDKLIELNQLISEKEVQVYEELNKRGS